MHATQSAASRKRINPRLFARPNATDHIVAPSTIHYSPLQRSGRSTRLGHHCIPCREAASKGLPDRVDPLYSIGSLINWIGSSSWGAAWLKAQMLKLSPAHEEQEPARQ
eukprot:CAMPEP_0206141574 /NCGR_PEP_ID=MMETSP1473-20131121/13434_1 /ASSEMBLY_ACC=CAM_ASM_001109 /TAXON_ID=1461547 /ORGANISM="Stichococcus sp, Strain RCC1054" /LENGTH=108 /DNA_ID=CAMNT_0053536197 /DNA_START=445 /DNA_END=768 /DNA_ORIENTATION=+